MCITSENRIFYFFTHINLITWNPIYWAEKRETKLEYQLHTLSDVYIKVFCYYKYKMHYKYGESAVVVVQELKTRGSVGMAPLILFLDTRWKCNECQTLKF